MRALPGAPGGQEGDVTRTPASVRTPGRDRRKLGRDDLIVIGAPVALASAVLLLALFPVGTLPYPPCPVHAATGLLCPGCGSTRMLSALAGGDLGTAWRQNPMGLLGLGYLVWSWARMSAREGSLRDLPWPRVLRRPSAAHPRVVLGVAALVLAWGVVRNFVPALAPY